MCFFAKKAQLGGSMKKYPTDKEIEEEVDYFLEHLDELAAKQQAERKAYFENPANAERIARTRQRLAIAEQLYKADTRRVLHRLKLPRYKFFYYSTMIPYSIRC